VNDVRARTTAESGHGEGRCSRCHTTDCSQLGRFASVSALGWVQTVACQSCAAELRAAGHALTYIGKVASRAERAVTRSCDRCREVGDAERVLVSEIQYSRERYWCSRCVSAHRATEPFEVVEEFDGDE